MIASTISPGATTAAVRVIVFGIRERLAHHAATRGDDHEQERPVRLGEEPAPFLIRILEVLHRSRDVAVDPTEDTSFRTMQGFAQLKLLRSTPS
jgi:hypothetical protein